MKPMYVFVGAENANPQGLREAASMILDQTLQIQPELWRFEVNPYAVQRTGLTLDKVGMSVGGSSSFSPCR